MNNPLFDLCAGIAILYIVWIAAFIAIYWLGRIIDHME